MTDQEKLVELLWEECKYDTYEEVADHLIANGVTVQGGEIERLKEENANLCIAINTLEEINRDLILRIESKKAHGWISVEERLPDKNREAVLIALCWGQTDIGWYDKDDKCWQSEFVNSYDDYEVTHWMPLPEPPKGE